ncbi:hypothetical protein GCM10018771_24190 [Streptomyces cellulosae]|nr:hypothetical protein GCM10018771_24190 [Streptomyces cellulosae]
MSVRTRVAALAALTATALAVGAAATAQAGAAPGEAAQQNASAQTKAAPRFLAASELPPHPTGWTAGPVTDGFPEQLAYCLGETTTGTASSTPSWTPAPCRSPW